GGSCINNFLQGGIVMRRKWFVGMLSGVALLSAMLLTDGKSAQADAELQIIQPHAAGQASGSLYFPLQNAFDSPDVDWDDTAGTVTGGPGAADAPYYSERVGYIDFGPDWAGVRIASTWTKYRASSVGNQTPYEELWWDDDT